MSYQMQQSSRWFSLLIFCYNHNRYNVLSHIQQNKKLRVDTGLLLKNQLTALLLNISMLINIQQNKSPVLVFKGIYYLLLSSSYDERRTFHQYIIMGKSSVIHQRTAISLLLKLYECIERFEGVILQILHTYIYNNLQFPQWINLVIC